MATSGGSQLDRIPLAELHGEAGPSGYIAADQGEEDSDEYDEED